MKEIRSHCIELSSGEQFSGTLSISNSSIELQLYGFDEHPHCNCESPIFLHKQKNEIVSLHANISMGNFRHGGPAEKFVVGEKIESGVAIIGNSKWQSVDRVKRVSFSIPDADKLLEDPQVIERIISKEILDYSDSLVFSIELSILRISLRYDITWYGGGYTRHSIKPRFEIEFRDSQDLTNYLAYVLKVAQYLSYCSGKFMSSADIKISSLSETERHEAIRQNVYSTDFGAFYSWGTVEEASSSRTGFAIGYLSVINEKRKTLFKESLSAWLSQEKNWENAFRSIMPSLRQTGILSGDRLMAAFRWFEQIPTTRSKQTLTDKEIARILCSARSVISELGLSENRLEGVLKTIKNESNSERISRLVNEVATVFGSSVFPIEVVKHLEAAMGFRNRCAHGHFEPADDDEFKQFHLATAAMEALCFLLVAKQLPLPTNVNETFRHAPFVYNYRIAAA